MYYYMITCKIIDIKIRFLYLKTQQNASYNKQWPNRKRQQQQQQQRSK